jgi:hypothetical protein
MCPPPAKQRAPDRLMPDRAGAAAGLLGLQRAAGNRAVGRLLATRPRERRLSRDFWDTLTKPVLPDPEPTAVTPRFEVWAEWDGPDPTRVNLSIAPGVPFPLVVPAGASGHVTMRVTMRTGNALQPVTQKMSYSWTVKTNEYGDIEQFKKRRVRLDPPSANPAPIAVRQKEWLTATEDAATRELRLSIDYGAGTEAVQSGEQDTSTGKFGGTVGAEGEGVKAGGTYEHTSSHTDSTGRQTTYAANMGNQDFAVKVLVANAKPRPPAPKRPEPPKTRRRTWIVLFKDPSNADVPADEEHWIHRWWGSLAPATRDGLKSGANKSLVLKGYASTRGKAKDNRKLAQARIDSVMEVLASDAGTKRGESMIKEPPEEHAFGEGMSMHATDTPQAETEAFYEKRVEVSVDDSLHSASDTEYRAVEQELIGRGEGLVIEQTELEKKRGSTSSR